MGVEIGISEDDERLRPQNSEVDRLLADNTKALELLGWRPSYAGLDGLRSGLSQTIDWFRRPENLRYYRAGKYTV